MLDILGNLGDFIGGIGVIVTVVYLAFQIRQSTASTKSASYQAVVSAVSDWSRTIGSDRDLARIMRIGAQDPSQLDVDEYTQYEMLTISVTRNFENIHYQHQCGGIPEAAWNGWSFRILSFYAAPGNHTLWQKHKRNYSAEFIAFIENGCKQYADNALTLGREAPPNKTVESDA